jgi:hypothetical protein
MEPSAADGIADQAVAGERTEKFLAMSVVLTGYGRVQLLGTGLTAAYLRAIDAALPAGVLDDLLAAFGRLPDDGRPSDPRGAPANGDRGVPGGHRVSPGDDRLEADGASTILDDPRLGPVARNVILLWYCGTWTALSDAWHAAYGASPLDATRVVSAQAYQGGLQWVAAGAHPAGAREQGFGAWAMPPQPSPPESPLPEGAGA